MSLEASIPRTSHFVTSRLPWIVGVSALGLYVLTLNRWVSLESLETVARASGWLWRPQLDRPLTFILLSPFRLLPQAWLPLVLNLATAACAAWVLVLLARSVALMPHDLVPNQPQRKPGQPQPPALLSGPGVWLPPVLAAIVCGLQLSFWEHATSASGEIIDLLVFAYVIRCLLEFRLHQTQAWLSRAAVLYGAGMANNWALIGFFPLFVAAIVRAKGYGPFRERKFLLRMALWGSAGLSLYLLLPLLHGLSSHGQVDAWTALKGHLRAQKEILGYWQRPAFRALAVASLLPMIVLSIRWKSHTLQLADDTRLGILLTRASVHLVHGFFLVCSVWLALDPTFSPRHLHLGTPMLSYYYLSALVFGYCAGYFLLFSLGPAGTGWTGNFRRRLIPATAFCLVCCLPLLLLWKNLGAITTTNGPVLQTFANDLHSDLPGGSSVALSDEPVELLLLRASLSAHSQQKQPILVEASSLSSPHYASFIAEQFPNRWPVALPTNRLERVVPNKLLELVSTLSTREPVVYLQPSWGTLFEFFTSQPLGCTWRLHPGSPELSTSNSVSQSPLLENDQLWEKRWTDHLQLLAKQTKENTEYPGGRPGNIFRRFRFARELNRTASCIGAAYAKRLNHWGTRLREAGHLTEAGVWFQRALELNPNNLSARINLKYGQNCLAGDPSRLKFVQIEREYSELFARYANWRDVLSANGPVDEPSFLFRTGRVLLNGGHNHQATLAFARSAELAPDWPAPKLWLAQSCSLKRDYARAMTVTDQLMAAQQLLDGVGLARLLECRVTALRGLGRTNEADALITDFVKQGAKHEEILSVAAELYSEHGQFGEALVLLEELLIRSPNQPQLLARKGKAQIQLTNYQAAIATLTSVLSLTPKNDDARLCRAVAYLGADQLEDARTDYLQLAQNPTSRRNALFGLGTIAWRQQNTNQAIEFYQKFLSNGIPGSPQFLVASERLKELKSTGAN